MSAFGGKADIEASRLNGAIMMPASGPLPFACPYPLIHWIIFCREVLLKPAPHCPCCGALTLRLLHREVYDEIDRLVEQRDRDLAFEQLLPGGPIITHQK